MKTRSQIRSTRLGTLCCALALSQAACLPMPYPRMGAGSAHPRPLSAARAAGMSAARGPVMVSGYRHTPTRNWIAQRHLQPSTPIANSRLPGARARCQAVSRGLQTVLPVPGGVESRTLDRWGPFELGIAGDVGSLGPLVRGDRQAFALEALATSARLAGSQTNCGGRFSLYVSVGPGSNPVSVLR